MASILSSLLIVLFCINSFHLCKCISPSFGVVNMNMAEKTQPLITKENEKLNPSRVSTLQPEEKYSINKMINSEATRKGVEQELGFDLDYVPPKTNPPIHNPGS
ncbi:hypothetical protein CASFOL_005849 [Castilleja foliolosa]|uniref:Uncharacterized protein n=1 Tax=Castilleja foliolosa TaxID=1961234 RepID=A0ABD3E4N6_9LAMI